MELRGPTRLGYAPALDGLRGLAIAAVCGVHFLGLAGGFLGVDLFFVLSGFLITTLVLEERDASGSVGLRRFYGRRARRLLPALAFLLAVVSALSATGVLSVTPSAAGFGVGALYVTNVARAFFHPRLAQLGPLWSLAQEEQFYVVWPIILVRLLRRQSPRRIAWMLLAVFAGLVAYRVALVATGAPWDRVYYAPDTHADGLVLGCALAFLRRAGLRVPSRLGVAALVLFVWLCFTTQWGAAWAAGSSLPVAELASGALILAALEPGLVRSVFSNFSIVWLGSISYSLYLWQGVGLQGIGLLGASGTAVVSYYAIERPFRRLRVRSGAQFLRPILPES